jgi:hypothetical protein
MANINPSKPNQGNILGKSPILQAGEDRTAKEAMSNREVVSKAMRPALGSNMKDVKKSITPTTRSKPFGEY